MKTTLNQIRACSPCKSGWTNLLAHLGKTSADDAPLSIITVLDSNGLDDALWCLQAVKGRDREIRLYALDVAERFANGEATDTERAAAWDAARAAARDVAGELAWDAAADAQEKRLRELCAECVNEEVRAADAAWASAATICR